MINVSIHPLANEAVLAARAVREPEAFAAIYDHYFPRVFTYVRLRVDDDSTADEVTAQIFERALTKIYKYRPEQAPFGAWLFGIARNTVNNHRRAERRHAWLSLDFIRHKTVDELHPEDSAVKKEMQDDLLDALGQLSERERDILSLKYIGGLTNRRIAGLTGLSESHVGVLVHRSLQYIRKVLEQKEAGDHEDNLSIR